MDICRNETVSKEEKRFGCRDHEDQYSCTSSMQSQVSVDSRKQQRYAWEASFASDPINLRELPKNVVLKARQIIQGLACQRNYREFHGKRLRHDRFIVSIPVTRNYRLLCRDYGNYLVPEAVISHAAYNVCKPGS